MTLVREPGSEILTQFAVPLKGTWKNESVQNIPVDALRDSLNVYVREGKLRTRPGLLEITEPFGNAEFIIGGGMVVDEVGKTIYALAPSAAYAYQDSINTWDTVPIPGSTFADNESKVLDMAFIERSNAVAVLVASEGRELKVRASLASSFLEITVLGGVNIPDAKSICIAGSRIIALVPPHTVVWSRILDFTNFDPLAIAKRAQTTDRGVCVRSLSALSFILYKEYSIHTARAQVGLDESTAFSFVEPIIVEGPAGIHAVVDVQGTHVYMTKSGRIAIFDGTGYPVWIADGIWFFLQEDIDQSQAYLIRGFYDYRLNIIVFLYPKVGTGFGLTGMVIINLPFKGFETQSNISPYTFLGTSDIPITHTCTKRFEGDIEGGVVFAVPTTDDVTQTLQLDKDTKTDRDEPFNCFFRTGLQSAPDASHIQFTVETFLERADGNGYVTVEPIISNSLETEEGTIPDGKEQRLNLDEVAVNEFLGFNVKARFFGLRYTWTSVNTVKYSGAVIYNSVIRRKNNVQTP